MRRVVVDHGVGGADDVVERRDACGIAADCGNIDHVTGSYVQDWLLHETDFNWRVLAAEGGALRAVADIGTHWLDLVQSVTGLEVAAVCADLRTFLPTRRRPQGSVETFQAKLGTPARPAGKRFVRSKGGLGHTRLA